MLHDIFNDKKLVLASSSPRRKDIFKMLGLNPLIMISDIDETLVNSPPWFLVKKHAFLKAKSVASHFNENTVIVAADTLVYINKTVLGKPRNSNEANYFLSMLSGTKHSVYTGVCTMYKNRQITEFAKSIVQFKPLSQKEISTYLKTGEPFDKAGAYGIQGYGCQFVQSISGCYFNVMGFPVYLFYKMVNEII